MDLLTLLQTPLGAATASGLASLAAAQYLSKRLLDHRLSKDLKDYDAAINEKLASHKATLDRQVNAAKAEAETRLKQQMDEYLGDRSAERNYRSEARKRLYLAVGPLRFQLLVAAMELVNRVALIGDGKIDHPIAIAGYFGQSSLYRLLRVLAVSELIERQITYADFAVDPAMRELLRFKREAFLVLSSHRVSRGHPQEDWKAQQQHVFHDVIGIVVSALIVQDTPQTPQRVMRFDEFAALIANDPAWLARIDPLPRLLGGFTPGAKPIVWLRLLALAQLCIGLGEAHGGELGLDVDAMDLDRLLALAQDAHIDAHHVDYREALARFRTAMADGPREALEAAP